LPPSSSMAGLPSSATSGTALMTHSSWGAKRCTLPFASLAYNRYELKSHYLNK
jgi:hypothetical protein